MSGKPSAASRRILRILARHGIQWPGGGDNAYIARTHAGHHMKAAGAFVWYLAPVDPTVGTCPDVGGYTPANAVRETWNAACERGTWIVDGGGTWVIGD